MDIEKEEKYAAAEAEYKAKLAKIDRELLIAKSVPAGATVLAVDAPFIQYTARSVDDVMRIIKSTHVLPWMRILGKGFHFTQSAAIPLGDYADCPKNLGFMFYISSQTYMNIRPGSTDLRLIFHIRTTQGEECLVHIKLCRAGTDKDYHTEYWPSSHVGPEIDVSYPARREPVYRYAMRKEMVDVFDSSNKEGSGSNASCNISHFIALEPAIPENEYEYYWDKLEKALKYIYQE